MWHHIANMIFNTDKIDVPRIIKFIDSVISVGNTHFSVTNMNFCVRELCSKTPDEIPDAIKHINLLLNLIRRHTKLGTYSKMEHTNKCRFGLGYPKIASNTTTIDLINNHREVKYKRIDHWIKRYYHWISLPILLTRNR
jgi:hypothetical protein